MRNEPETFEQAQAWAEAREAETGERPKSVTNYLRGLFFDLENSTVTKSVRDQYHNLVEMTYCAHTGSVLRKKVTKSQR